MRSKSNRMSVNGDNVLIAIELSGLGELLDKNCSKNFASKKKSITFAVQIFKK